MPAHEPKRLQHTPEEERRIREAALEQAEERSFAASDPPASNPNPDDHDPVADATGQQASDRSIARDAVSSPINVEEVKLLLEQSEPITFIDARNPIAWGSSKVKLPGAIRVPLDEADRLLQRLPRDRRLIVYCT
jgi:rhodanese-like protein